MTGPHLDRARAEALHRCAVRIEAANGFRGSGFLVGPGLAVTCAHVVLDRRGVAEGLVVRHESSTYPVLPGAVRAEPDTAGTGPFEAFPDLALLDVPAAAGTGHPVAPLAGGEAEPGSWLTALGHSEATPSPGVNPDTVALQVVGRSGELTRVGGFVQPGFSGSMLVGSDGLVCGVLKGSRSYKQDLGGWYVPLAALIAFLGPVVQLVAPEPSPSDTELVAALMAVRYTARADGRFDLLERMGEHLGLPHSFEVEERSDRRDHLFRIVSRCRHHRDASAALRALYAALAELAPYDGALDRLRSLVERATGEHFAGGPATGGGVAGGPVADGRGSR
ncbi:S1 family peptidase [Kitasatospora cathayae]|uniref:Serine protease n=1 Tax=Kitasatospora cathayae TaxID=3004092 RepID=A0ABY7PYC7_9ACTN|nr:serine protease [Kitasatospora sp. HUAS 3-15]WBP85396.1 serine protease [Kitasatospora sp. HUAS 3-15]